MQSVRLCRVSVAVPHYYKEGTAETGYGSTRVGTWLARQLALARCLSGVLALNRQPQDLIFNHAQVELEVSPPLDDCTTQLEGVQIDLHLFVNGENYLREVVEQFTDRLTLHSITSEDPRYLPLSAATWLVQQRDQAADLSLYLEDDLVIQDPRYIDKQFWFTERTEHQFVLMPHRLEFCVYEAPMRLYVDGPIKRIEQKESVWSDQEKEVARENFWDGRSVGFTFASNPHSGSFCLSTAQRQRLVERKAQPTEFIGPLETAATGTVLNHFPIWKPVWRERDFLCLEHGHPSFLSHLGAMKLHSVGSQIA